MKGVLSPKPTALLPKVCFFLVRKTIHFAVWASVALEGVLAKRPTNKPPDESRKPNYVQCFLSSLLTEDDRIGILGDWSQHYERLFNDFGEVEANKWLKEEVAESALHLILRREGVKHIFRSIRNLCVYTFRPKTVSTRANDGCVAVVSASSFRVRHFAFISLLAMALGSMLVFFHDRSRLVKKVDTSTDKPVTSDEIAFNNRGVQDSANQKSAQTPRQLRTRPDIVRNRSNALSNIPTTEVSLARLDPGERTDQPGQVPSQNNVPPTVVGKRYRFSMALPAGSRTGSYEVILQDSSGRRLAGSWAKSTDGKAVSATFDMERFPANEYQISVSQKGVESPNLYRFKVKAKPGER